MKSQVKRSCPLFARQVPRVRIQTGKEGRAPGNLIVRLIQAGRADWPAKDRASRDGRQSFAAIGRVTGFSKGFRKNQGIAERPTSRFASQTMANILWLDLERYSIPIQRLVVAPCTR
jgi:hypothetical protein